MFALRHPKESTLKRLLENEVASDVSYPEVGATAGVLPTGYTHDSLSTVIGSGRSVFRHAGNHLDEWGLQKSVGFRVFPDDSRVAKDQTVLLSIPIGPSYFVVSARVIYRVDEVARHGFAYGTLPSHDEIGEEYFGVSIDSTDVVRFEIKAFSKPGSLIARAGTPVTRRFQSVAMRKYLTAMSDFGKA